MKLYKVTIEHTFFMVAEDDADASIIAQGEAAEALRTDLAVDLITEEEVTCAEDIPAEWRKACPYGEGGNVRSCEEWLVNAE